MKKIIRTTIYIICFGIVLYGFIFFGNYEFKNDRISDNEKIAKKFSSLNSDNKYKIIDIDDVLNIIDKNGIILFAYPENDWADYYAGILNDAAKETIIDKIYIYNLYNDRAKNNKEYQKLLSKLNKNVIVDDENKEHIFAPTLLIIKDGQIMYFDNETAEVFGNMTVKNYWNENNREAKKQVFITKINEYLGGNV